MVNLKEVLDYIDPCILNYDEWKNVGMGLKAAANAGYNVSWQDWEDWSRRDPARFKQNECEKKWYSFNSSGININTVIMYAMQNGYQPQREVIGLGWDDEIDDGIPPQEDRDFIMYIKTLFDNEDLVSVAPKSIKQENGKYTPIGQGFFKSAKELVAGFERHHGEIENVIGDYDHNAGVWIRFNPMDGKGISNDNVAQYRYTLIESDKTDIETQLETIYKLRLPCAAIVHSGGRSIHAIVKIGADDLEEYNRRVAFLHKTLERQNFPVDKQNKNPARLSRLPGVDRGKERQFLINVNVGYSDFTTWQEYVENGFLEIELPEIESFKDYLKNMPELAPELIKGILRRGHKMLLSGSSKAGKSFALIELAIALAEGRTWLGYECAKSKVLYINLEIDRSSFANRINDVCKAMGIKPHFPENLNVWNLRGRAQPMRKLTRKIIKRIQSENYDAIILDPVYKVQSGDENAAGDIAAFTNEFDRLTTELGVSLIYCHHHSKGNQGGKRSIDRASGSGVFARDPDAILDMIELDNKTYQNNKEYRDCTAWRIEGTLREFATPEPVNVFFKFPLHVVDHFNLLADAEYRDYTAKEERRSKGSEDLIESIDNAFNLSTEDGITAKEKDMMQFLGIAERTFRRKLSNYNTIVGSEIYTRKNGIITLNE